MSNDPLYAGTCTCGNTIIRRTLAGVAPKRCTTCRNDGAIRRGRDAGPPQQMKRWMIEQRHQLAASNAGSPNDLMRECAAVAVADAIGIDDDMADSILCAIEALVDDGETGLQIRKRLNAPTFGLKRAAEYGAEIGLDEAIMSFDTRQDD